MTRTKIVYSVLGTLALLSITTSAFAVVLDDNMRVVIPKSIASDIGTIAAFDYDQANNTFYVGVFGGEAGFRTITNDGTGWNGNWDTNLDSSTSTMLRFIRSTDVPGGATSVKTSGKSYMGGILLNPAPLTLDVPVADASGNPIPDGNGGYQTTPVTYGAGELAYIIDGATTIQTSDGTKRPDCTKLMYRWDLRGIDDSTTALPDFANASSGLVDDNDNPTWIWGATGVVDWNDMLSVVFTEQDLHDAATAGGASAPGTDNLMRQFIWSSDGQSIYFAEKSTYQGGIYKVDPRTGNLSWIYHENQDSHVDPDPDDDISLTGGGIKSEPTVVNTATCDYSGGQYTGDQIIFGGTKANGNYGGLNYITDNASGTSPLQVLLSASEFHAWAENDGLVTDETTATDSQGNIYFYADGTDSVSGLKTGGIFKRDTAGDLSCVASLAEIYELCYSADGTRQNSGSILRMKSYEDAEGVHLLFRGDNAYIAEVDVTMTGDMNGDNIVDTTDCAFMIEQYKKSCYDTIPTVGTDGVEVFLDYLMADMNGSAASVYKGTGTLDNVGVTFTDVEDLAQYIEGGLILGDFNWDGIFDDADWAIFDANFETTPESGVWSWFDGDLDLDGDVDAADRALISEAIPGDANRDGKVDGSDVTILANNWQAGVSGDETATWEMGDFNNDGKVDGSDVTILANNWQTGVDSVASAVPEPSTIVMILLGFSCLAIRRVTRLSRC